MSERTFVAIAHSHRMGLEQASHNNNASTFRHYASSAIKRLEEWAPTLDELEATKAGLHRHGDGSDGSRFRGMSVAWGTFGTGGGVTVAVGRSVRGAI